MSLTSFLAIFALIASGGAVFRFSGAGIVACRAALANRRRRQFDTFRLRQAAEIARLNSELNHGQSNGLDWRVMEVAEVLEESDDCRSFYLVDPYRQPLPSFRPGQYLMVRPAMAGAYQTTRCYSLSSSPNKQFWRITVKRQECENNRIPAANGGLSSWLHDTISEGDCLLIGGPSGQFFLPENSTRPLVLLAAGVGITPMASMLRWSMEQTPGRFVALLYQAKDYRHWPLGVSLHSWQDKSERVRVHTFFSRADDAEVQAAAGELPGQFTAGKFTPGHALTALPNPQDNDYYMCGPDTWMKANRDALLEAGVPAEQVHWESFGGTGAQPNSIANENATSCSVRFEHSQIDTQWADPRQSVWELARENHVEIPSGCLSGVCGCCRVKLLAGNVEYDREIAVELADDECLTCVARPTSPLVVDA